MEESKHHEEWKREAKLGLSPSSSTMMKFWNFQETHTAAERIMKIHLFMYTREEEGKLKRVKMNVYNERESRATRMPNCLE